MSKPFDGYGVCNGVDVIPSEAQEKLKNEVLERMAQGWIPQGGIALVVLPTSPNATYMFVQAIVRPLT